MFLNEGADINAIGKYGTVLQLAALEGKVEVIRLLVPETKSDKSRRTTPKLQLPPQRYGPTHSTQFVP